MTTDFSDPTYPVPDFPGVTDAEGGFAAPGVTHLDSKETSVHPACRGTYRDFLTSSCQRETDFVDRVYQSMDAADGSHKAADYIGCRTTAWFVRHNVSGEIRVASSKCKLRWCPLCIKSRRYVITHAAQKWLFDLDRPKFLTLTLKHSNAPLLDQIHNLYRLFREFRRRPWVKKRIKGGIWFFQIKRSTESGQWHPHLHILLDSKFIPKEELSQKWLETTKNSKIIDIRAVTNVRKAAEYVARYAAAPCRLCDYSLDDAIEIVRAMHGLRIVGTFGTAKGVKLSAQKPEDSDCWERIGDFREVMQTRHFIPLSEIIWQSWTKSEPCNAKPPEPPPMKNPEVEILTEPPVTYRQFVFEFNHIF